MEFSYNDPAGQQPAENQQMYSNGEPAAQTRGKSSAPGGGHHFAKGFVAGLVTAALVCGAFYAVGASSGSIIAVSGTENSAINETSVQKLQMLEEQIDAVYYKADEVTQEQKEEGLYKGLLESLDDPYSVYYTEEEVEELTQSLDGTFKGIGVYIMKDQTTGYARITSVFADSPAEKAGLMANDIIYEVDGESMSGVDLDGVAAKVRGEDGTDVELTIYREGESDYLHFTVTRGIVDTPTVSGKVLDDGIGYLQITEFDGVTTDQFETALQDLYDQDIKALVLDLRDNPGGDVDVVTAIANDIIPAGLIFYMEEADGNRTDYTADGTNAVQIPLAVLVNGNSASASEILTGAVQDSGCGTVIGTQTYGKGVVQSVYSLRDGTAVKLTIANYYTRDGHDINKVGITPDIEVELDTEAYVKDGTDNQLQKAIEVLKDKMN